MDGLNFMAIKLFGAVLSILKAAGLSLWQGVEGDILVLRELTQGLVLPAFGSSQP